jgi:hypothetical protein
MPPTEPKRVEPKEDLTKSVKIPAPPTTSQLERVSTKDFTVTFNKWLMLSVKKGDITHEVVDAITNAANE